MILVWSELVSYSVCHFLLIHLPDKRNEGLRNKLYKSQQQCISKGGIDEVTKRDKICYKPLTFTKKISHEVDTLIRWYIFMLANMVLKQFEVEKMYTTDICFCHKRHSKGE